MRKKPSEKRCRFTRSEKLIISVRDVVFILFKALFTPDESVNVKVKHSANGDIDVGTENGFCVCVTFDTIQTLTLTPTLMMEGT